ncbi:amino acid ABC transporter permease [Bradyrhizobium diazoefficiens]|nr:amino acid ABC transporter permease [Bradyrhizobium diazoefficiens]MBR0965672.1 amino acid ABC transporter permease [Bradyrhizobium diazoefficiens]MBR0979364.1 amino acid ABC transporter permease [Bradyrhizobium diazoefficiens]MBR1008556.1 amino acid ABC transporter permease [Bradyrhizobium diazoefficiens]MBR1014695.1 amino acid ABC transporter permease [Bradyrhizobium diazoefficiens]MBR1052517.1 amino acid ABC transporter permease [Bradyrhizobium diazoefficiens]
MYEFDWSLPFRSPFGGWLLYGLSVTLYLTLASTILSLLLGVLVAIGRFSASRLPRSLAAGYVELFRNVPTLFWIIFFYYVAPELVPADLSVSVNGWAGLPFAAALAGLALSNAAHVAELVRAGIQAIPARQKSAALALGVGPVALWIHVLLPQAIRFSLPALGPRMVHNCHNSALAMVIAVPEIVWQTRQIETTTFRGFEAVTIATLAFIVLTLAVGGLFRLLEYRMKAWAV